MMIADVIRNAKTEHEIYCLLIAYLEAMQFGNTNIFISKSTLALPLGSTDDLQKRFDQLFVDLDNASKALDNHACLAVKEALHIFGSALHQLHHIQATNKHRPLNDHHRREIAGREKRMLARHQHPHTH